MSKQIARDSFLGKNSRVKLNCAQSIIEAFNGCFDDKRKIIDLFDSYGGGKAPDGLCGAYYAGLYILKRKYSKRTNEFKRYFKMQVGFDTCEALKANKVSCLDCVEKSAEFLEIMS